MSTEYQIWSAAEAYAGGTLPAEEQAQLQERLKTDPVFASNFQECVNIFRSLNAINEQKRLRNTLKDIHNKQNSHSLKIGRSISFNTNYWSSAAIAAGVAILISLSTWLMLRQNNNDSSSHQYNLVRRELENIKRSQRQIINNINTKNQVPPATVKYTGTGFAISNDGYLFTSYHVIKDADSVYIQNAEGHNFKAVVKAFDPNSDIAILKVEQKSFRFAKAEVPYTFAAHKANLSSRVYTLGFPDEDIVYSEGYISGRNGYESDSIQYRLELPVDPGQSGSPVLDEKGNVLAIVTARGDKNEGSTYAVSSGALLQLIQTLPKSANLHLSKTNKLSKLGRQQQVEKMENYTCPVKVFKK